MITGVHAIFYTTDAVAARAFFRDKLKLPHYEAGEGWPLYRAPSGEIGCHPAGEESHGISFSCDDIEATMTELAGRGVVFTEPVKEEPWGFVTSFAVPGSLPVQLYQPRYERP